MSKLRGWALVGLGLMALLAGCSGDEDEPAKRVLVFCSSLLKNGWMISPKTLAIRQIHAP